MFKEFAWWCGLVAKCLLLMRHEQKPIREATMVTDNTMAQRVVIREQAAAFLQTTEAQSRNAPSAGS
jgi:hypothetical protein